MQTRNIFYIYERSVPESWMQQKRKERVSKIESIRRRKRKMSEEKREGKHIHESQSIISVHAFCHLTQMSLYRSSTCSHYEVPSTVFVMYSRTHEYIAGLWIWREKGGLARRNRIYFVKGDIVTPLFFPVFNLFYYNF